MRHFAVACALTGALALAGHLSGAAAGQTESTTLSAKKSRQASRQIACTVFGCHPIPRGCRIETEYDFWGNPTGFDRVVCPPR